MGAEGNADTRDAAVRRPVRQEQLLLEPLNIKEIPLLFYLENRTSCSQISIYLLVLIRSGLYQK